LRFLLGILALIILDFKTALSGWFGTEQLKHSFSISSTEKIQPKQAGLSHFLHLECIELIPHI